ncbi:MAG: type II toxin-antitoxin system HipA family toxin [Oscillospiraceae bacterium]|nr:type II toxin-antitoxin system HipA family toxin [Oscillospiraceae bacterium]
MSTFYVYNNTYVGKCYWTEKRSRINGVFSYDDDYLSGKENWTIDPALSLVIGAQPSKNGLPGAFRDASPDRWGQTLIRHRYRKEYKDKSKQTRRLNDVDYLMGVSDFSRQGDLRFSLEKDGVFEHPSDNIPQLTALPKLLYAAHNYEAENEENAITFLLNAGSASLGGARPKAAVIDGEDLFIAKFPHKQDKWDVMAWEWVCLNIAAEAGIDVPENRLVLIDGQNVLLVKRFDRAGIKRIGYISAMTMLGLSDGEHADYYEIAEKLRDISISVKDDLYELYKRIILNILLNNTDDHLRNHGLVHSGSGWKLSPVFDINPTPDSTTLRVTSIFSELEKERAITALKRNCQVFNISLNEADKVLSDVQNAIKKIEIYTKKAGIPKDECKMVLNAIGFTEPTCSKPQ